MNQPSTARYDGFSRALHWLTAIVVTLAFSLGPEGFGRLVRQGVDPATRSSIVWHESLGIAVLALTALRLLWVAVRPAAPQVPMANGLRIASRVIHGSLWVLLLTLPVTALLALGGEGHPLTLLGGVRVERIPFIVDSGVGRLADWGDVHGFLGDLTIGLAGLHATAAIFHHFVLRDGVLQTMLPFAKAR